MSQPTIDPPQYGAELRQAILAEAGRRLAESGPEKLGLRPLAASQGTSTTEIYTMFGGKSGLLAAVAADADAQLAAALREVLRHGSVESDMRALCRSYRQWAIANPGLYPLVVEDRSIRRTAIRPEEISHPKWMEPLLEVVDALVDEDVFRQGDIHDMATAIWASLHGIVSLEIAVWQNSPSAEQFFEAQVAAILRSWVVGAEPERLGITG